MNLRDKKKKSHIQAVCLGPQEQPPVTGATGIYEWTNILYRLVPSNWENAHKSLWEGCSCSSEPPRRPRDDFANAPRVLSSPLGCPSLLCRALALTFSPRLHDSLTLLSLLFEPCPQGTTSRNGQGFLAHHLEAALCISRQASLSLGWADDPSDKIKMCSLHSTPSFTGEWWHLPNTLLAFKMVS